jgi:3',5'-cyclic AMP phosphodiesterase CpdA
MDTEIILPFAFTGNKETKIWLISDIHIGFNDQSKETFKKAISETDNTTDLDYVFVLGDLVHDGNNISEYKDYLEIKSTSRVASANWYEIPGNHDKNSKKNTEKRIRNFLEQLNYTHATYNLDINNIHFIFLGDEEENGVLTDYQLKWLKKEINNNANKNIIILNHYGLENTTYRTVYSVTLKASDKIKKIMNGSTVVAFFHGHLHKNLKFPNWYRIPGAL